MREILHECALARKLKNRPLRDDLFDHKRNRDISFDQLQHNIRFFEIFYGEASRKVAVNLTLISSETINITESS